MNQGLDWDGYLIVIAALGFGFFCSALYALAWAAKKGTFRRFEAQALSIFDASEPVGLKGDTFPDASSKKTSKHTDLNTKI